MKKIFYKILCIALSLLSVTLIACNNPPQDEGRIKQTSMIESNDFSSNTDYSLFISKAKTEYLIPGLNEGFIPQGMDVWEEKDLLLISGYFSSYEEHPGSMIVSVNLKTGKLAGYYYLKKNETEYYKGHAGGLAVTNKNLIIGNAGNILRIPLVAFENVENGGSLNAVEIIKVPVMAAYCNYSGGMLWIGDFYNYPQHDTRQYHDGLMCDDKYYSAWTVGYKLDGETESEFSTEAWNSSTEVAIPDCVIGTPEKIQGFTVIGNQVALSQSFGRINNSNIKIFDFSMEGESQATVTIGDKIVPAWGLKTAVQDYVAPPMTEGITVYNDKLLILFESATLSYIKEGAINPTDHVWSMDLSK